MEKNQRIERIQQQLKQFAQLDFSKRIPVLGKGDDIDAIIVELNAMGEELGKRSLRSGEDERRINDLIEALLRYTLMDFSQKLEISDKGDELDAIAVGLNTLKDELESNMQLLKENHEKYFMLFNSIDEGYCVIEMIFDEKKKPIDYRFLEINESFEKQTGLHNAVGKRMREFAPDHEEHWFEMYGTIALTGEPKRFENRAEKLNRWYDVYAFRFGEPKNMQVAILFNDITERRRAEEAMKNINQYLEQKIVERTHILESKNRQLIDFCNIVSHNLRAPLINIAMLIDFVEEGVNEEERKMALSKMKPVVNHLNEVFNELVESVQVKQDIEIKSEKIILEDSLREVLKGLETQIKMYEADIEIDFSEAPIILFPQKYIESIFSNLISNSLKYRSPNRKPEIKIKTEKINENIVLSVADNGLGIDLELHKDRLFKIRKVFHDHPDAKGFGLFMTKTQVEAMGGKIWAESTPNKGSKFFVEFINQNI